MAIKKGQLINLGIYWIYNPEFLTPSTKPIDAKQKTLTITIIWEGFKYKNSETLTLTPWIRISRLEIQEPLFVEALEDSDDQPNFRITVCKYAKLSKKIKVWNCMKNPQLNLKQLQAEQR